MIKYILANFNSSSVAQDLLFKRIHDWNIDFTIIAEPNFIAEHWFTDTSKKVAIAADKRVRLFCILEVIGDGFLSMSFHDILFIAAYLSPNLDIEIFCEQIDAIAEILKKYRGKKVILLGDFNANSTIWGSNFNSRRAKYWNNLVNVFDLRLANDKGIHTCFRSRGSSVVDLVWFSPTLTGYIYGCKVLDLEKFYTFSDHCYLRFNLRFDKNELRNSFTFRRLSRTQFNYDRFSGALLAIFINDHDLNTMPVESLARNIRDNIVRACDFAAPRIKATYKTVY